MKFNFNLNLILIKLKINNWNLKCRDAQIPRHSNQKNTYRDHPDDRRYDVPSSLFRID